MKARLRVFGTEQTVLRPIVVSVLKDIVNFLGGGQKNEVYYHIDDNNGVIKKHGHDKNALITNVINNYKEIIRVSDIKETVADGFNNSLTMMFPDEYPFFVDKETEFQATFIKQRTKVDISFEYIVQDKILLEGMLNMLKTNAVYSSGVVGHNYQYSVVIPKFLRNLLIYIHKYKEKYTPEEDYPEFQDYLNQISDARLVFNLPHDEDYNGSSITFREKEMSMEGRFEEDLEDVEMEEAENNAYSISLTYSFEYQKVVAVNVDYPIYVHNQKLPNELFNVFKHEEQINHKSHFGPMAKFYNLYGKYPRSFGGGIIEGTMVLPPHDRRLNDNYPSFYTRLLTQLIRLEEGNTRSLINIRNFTGIKFKDSFERLMFGSEREYIGKFRRSLLWVALYENNTLLQDLEINIDEDGNMTIDRDLDMRKTYRIGVFLMLNINYLKQEDRDRLQDYLDIDHKNNRSINNKRKEMSNTQVSLTNPKGESLINPFTVTNSYLSNLDILAKIYRLTPDELKRIAENANQPTEAFFNLVNNKRIQPSLDRYTQIMSIFYCLDVKE